MTDDYDSAFEEILSRAYLESVRDTSVEEHANILAGIKNLDENTTIIEDAKKALLKEDAKKLYLECLKDIVSQMGSASQAEKFRWAYTINSLGLQGLGIKLDYLNISSPDINNITLSSPDWNKIENHINDVVLGETFLKKMSVPQDDDIWGTEFPLRISACDASQHRGKLKIPIATDFSSPFVVNNAAGIVKVKSDDKASWENIIVPKNTQDFENWVIVGYKDYTELTEQDFEWATKSAMDVGEFYVEENRIFQGRGVKNKPDIHFRDGRVFPQDHAMNCTIPNRHGELTREAILRMTSTLKKAKELGITFCGVAKRPTLKLYSTIIDWYITKKMGIQNWNLTKHTLSDTELMRRFLYNSDFNAQDYKDIYVTVPIIRSFYTTSNLNRRTDRQVQNDLNRLKGVSHSRGITAYDIVSEALNYNVVLFFAGHMRTNEIYVPRYEFVYYKENKEDIYQRIIKLLSGIRLSTLDVDSDHLWGLEEGIYKLYLLQL